MTPAAAAPHKAFDWEPEDCDVDRGADETTSVTCSAAFGFGTKTDCNQSSTLVCAGLVRGVGMASTTGVIGAVGSMEPKTLTQGVWVGLAVEMAVWVGSEVDVCVGREVGCGVDVGPAGRTLSRILIVALL